MNRRNIDIEDIVYTYFKQIGYEIRVFNWKKLTIEV